MIIIGSIGLAAVFASEVVRRSIVAAVATGYRSAEDFPREGLILAIAFFASIALEFCGIAAVLAAIASFIVR